jgi:D-alanyl-lipoteichoic acid acyltransferase DltB (MBOAT superfamily)
MGVGLPDRYEGFDFFLPLAISFYTFQLIAYAVDVYRGVIPVDPGPRRFFLFILFFPQLIAGPIMRSTDFMDQIDQPQINRRRMYDGLWLIIGGLAKKVLLADPAGNFIAPVFHNPDVYDWSSILLAGIGFSLQVYGDFSGYTDLARGSARLLGYEIPENFLAPFFSRSAKELWQRWHITLASWLRDYIYIPLGGSRVGKLRNYLNLVITFSLGGLWHGADYTFLAWGGMWGVLLAAERWVENDLGINTVPKKSRLLIAAKVAFMFFLFSLGAIMFRSQPVHHNGHDHSSGEIMVHMLSGLFTNGPDMIRNSYINSGGDAEILTSVFGNAIFAPQIIPNIESLTLVFIFMTFFHLIQYRSDLFERWRKYDPVLLIAVSMFMGGYMMPVNITGSHQFIYFVF